MDASDWSRVVNALRMWLSDLISVHCLYVGDAHTRMFSSGSSNTVVKQKNVVEAGYFTVEPLGDLRDVPLNVQNLSK